MDREGQTGAAQFHWTTTGLNFLGFPTPANAAPNFANYLAPAPSLDLAKSLQNSARVFRYPGGKLGATNPAEVVSFTAATTPVTRWQAFWVQGSTNYYNRYPPLSLVRLPQTLTNRLNETITQPCQHQGG